MSNWKDPKAYEKKFDRAGWAWQFMRRNPKYRADFAHVRKVWKLVPKSGHFFRGGKALEAERIGLQYGVKWGQLSAIENPASDKAPVFLTFGPAEPDGEQVEGFFYVPNQASQQIQRREFATLTFDLRRPIAPQVTRARSLLRRRQKHVKVIRPTRSSEIHWRLYLRVLDAKEAKAKTSEIVAAIPEYKKLPKVADAKYPASDRVSDHYQRALALRDDPLSVIL